MARKGLGRGLDALIPEFYNEDFDSNSALSLEDMLSEDETIDDIVPETTESSEEEVVEEEEVPSITIEELELSVRAYNCLKRASINSMAELLKKSEHDLLNIKNFGKKSSDEVIERLHEHGLDLAPSPEMDENGMLIGE